MKLTWRCSWNRIGNIWAIFDDDGNDDGCLYVSDNNRLLMSEQTNGLRRQPIEKSRNKAKV